jgi:anti-repressor protein
MRDSSLTTIDLQVRDDGRVPMVNSTVVAKNFGKRHDHILRDIDGLRTSPDLGRCDWFREVETQVPGGNGAALKVRSFDLTREGFTLLAMGWTGAKALRFKVAYIAEFNRMEAALRATPTPAANLNDPHTLRAALLGYTECVIALEGENAALGAKVEHLAPKAAALDLIADKSGAENISTTAKGLRIRPGELFTFLNNKGWVYRAHDGAPWRAYQAKIDAGYLVVRETPDKTRDDRTFMQVLVTPKGRAKLAEMLTQGDMLRSNTKRGAA